MYTHIYIYIYVNILYRDEYIWIIFLYSSKSRDSEDFNRRSDHPTSPHTQIAQAHYWESACRFRDAGYSSAKAGDLVCFFPYLPSLVIYFREGCIIFSDTPHLLSHSDEATRSRHCPHRWCSTKTKSITRKLLLRKVGDNQLPCCSRGQGELSKRWSLVNLPGLPTY